MVLWIYRLNLIYCDVLHNIFNLGFYQITPLRHQRNLRKELIFSHITQHHHEYALKTLVPPVYSTGIVLHILYYCTSNNAETAPSVLSDVIAPQFPLLLPLLWLRYQSGVTGSTLAFRPQHTTSILPYFSARQPNSTLGYRQAAARSVNVWRSVRGGANVRGNRAPRPYYGTGSF